MANDFQKGQKWLARQRHEGSSNNYTPYVSDGDTARVLFFMNLSGAYGGFAGREEAWKDARLIAGAVNLVRTIARMTYDGEEMAGKEFVMENDDAITTMNDLIMDARNLTDGQEG